jgi:hypothetical protein
VVPDDRPQPPAILASDAEREQSIATLQAAVVGGRLTLEEFSERVGRAQLARTDQQLAPLVADLPSGVPAPLSEAPVANRAICSRLVRGGPWQMPAHSAWRSIFGTIDLDLRQARLPGRDVELTIHNFFGTVTVLVPEGVSVEVVGGGMFASQVIDPGPSSPPIGAPRLRINASGPGGTLYVRSPGRRTAPHRALDQRHRARD